MTHIVRTRAASETSAATLAESAHSGQQIQAGVLAMLLDMRKASPTRAHAKQLAQQQRFDADLFERLAKYVNTPSIGRTRAATDGTEQRQVYEVCGSL